MRFSSATGPLVATHYILGWNFKVNGIAKSPDISRLPKLPHRGPKKKSKFFNSWVSSSCGGVYITDHLWSCIHGEKKDKIYRST